MPSYHYKKGFKPYKRDFNELSLRVRKILSLLKEEKGRGRLNRIALKVGVSRCFVWQVAHRGELGHPRQQEEEGEPERGR